MLTLWPPRGCWNLLCGDLGRAKGICVSTCPLRTKALLNELGKEVASQPKLVADTVGCSSVAYIFIILPAAETVLRKQ